jgi:hypothetical protein
MHINLINFQGNTLYQADNYYQKCFSKAHNLSQQCLSDLDTAKTKDNTQLFELSLNSKFIDAYRQTIFKIFDLQNQMILGSVYDKSSLNKALELVLNYVYQRYFIDSYLSKHATNFMHLKSTKDQINLSSINQTNTSEAEIFIFSPISLNLVQLNKSYSLKSTIDKSFITVLSKNRSNLNATEFKIFRDQLTFKLKDITCNIKFISTLNTMKSINDTSLSFERLNYFKIFPTNIQVNKLKLYLNIISVPFRKQFSPEIRHLNKILISLKIYFIDSDLYYRCLKQLKLKQALPYKCIIQPNNTFLNKKRLKENLLKETVNSLNIRFIFSGYGANYDQTKLAQLLKNDYGFITEENKISCSRFRL